MLNKIFQMFGCAVLSFVFLFLNILEYFIDIITWFNQLYILFWGESEYHLTLPKNAEKFKLVRICRFQKTYTLREKKIGESARAWLICPLICHVHLFSYLKPKKNSSHTWTIVHRLLILQTNKSKNTEWPIPKNVQTEGLNDYWMSYISGSCISCPSPCPVVGILCIVSRCRECSWKR